MSQESDALPIVSTFFPDSSRYLLSVGRTVSALIILCAAMLSLVPASGWGQQNQLDASDFQLGQKYESSGSYAAAYGLYQRAADAGNADASFRIGSFYEDGKLGNYSAESDEAVFAAYSWYVQSARQGSISAQLVLAQWLMTGKGKAVAKDPEDALPYLQQLAAQRDKLSAANLRWVEQSIQWVHPQQQEVAATTNSDNSETTSESTSDWEQDHQNKIDELNQEIADHERQAQQDDADAQQAESQASQNSGISGMFGALANAVNTGLNAGLAQKQRRDAERERQQAEDERQQLAELGAEQPPVAQNNSTEINLTRMQTGMINSGQTIQGALNQQENNIQAVQQVQANAQQVAQQVANGTLTPQQAVQQIQQQAQQAANQETQAQPQSQTASPCVGFPAFITAAQLNATPQSTIEQIQYFNLYIQFNTPSSYHIAGGQVGIYQGSEINTALQEIQQGNLMAEGGEGDTSAASGNFVNGLVTLNTAGGNGLIGSVVTLSNGSYQLSYYGYTQATVPTPFALTLKETTSSCQNAVAGPGAGTVN